MTQNIRENHYNQRFGFFKAVQFPRYKTYKQYLEQTPQETVDQLLDYAKVNLLEAKYILHNLESTDPALRNKLFLKNEELKEMQLIIVSNSLCITKVKMEEQGLLHIKIDFEKSVGSVPAIDLYKK